MRPGGTARWRMSGRRSAALAAPLLLASHMLLPRRGAVANEVTEI
jgi:hypothetical protein